MEATTMEYGDNYEYYDENDTACDFSEWEPSYSLIPVLYMLIFILGLSGNGVVIFTVWRSKSKRRAADVYIGNLALADLTFVVTLPLWAVYTALGYHWPFGVALCKISSYVVLVNMYASVFCLTCLSFDRYLAIVHSLSSSRLRSRSTMLASLGAIWFLSGLLALPTLLFRTTVNDPTSNRTTCAMDFSLVTMNQRHESLWIAGLSLSSSALGFLVPFLAMTIFYCFIGCTVTRHFNNLRKEDQKKKRLLKIITTLVVATTMEYGDNYEYYDENDTACDFSEWEHPTLSSPSLHAHLHPGVCQATAGHLHRLEVQVQSAGQPDVYIGNLALADLTFALGYHWPVGVALCKIKQLRGAVLTRYLAIVHSLSSSRLRPVAPCWPPLVPSGSVWTFLALPTLLFRTHRQTHQQPHHLRHGLQSWSHEPERHGPLWIAGLSLSSSALGFLVPFLAMTIFYCFIGCTVTRHFNNLRKEDQKKKRLLKIITTLVVVFAICWTPFHVLKSMDALSYLNLAPSSCGFLRFLLLAHPYATCLAYVNSCLNPFLYAFFDLRFRSQCLCLLNLKKAMHGQISSMSSTLSAQTQKSEIQSLATKV
ncbi:hypothetical protein CRUP_012809 [Coryphaenoides rupestris]|nr:hypothetical protein CRUP_012809 [Coryphaenoides rupestris]